MKQIVSILLLCLAATTVSAKSKITRSYHNESLSKVLEDLNAASNSQTIYFIYDELEDFTVTCSFKRLSLDDAVLSSASTRWRSPVRAAESSWNVYRSPTTA